MVLVGALARLGAVQNPMLPIYREREVGFITKQTGAKLLIVPSVWRGFDFEAMAARRSPTGTPASRCSSATSDLPDGDPSTLPPAPVRRAFDRRTTDGRALGLLHVGHDRRPEGRAAHRRHDRRRVGVRDGRSCSS